jgi:hypothetical protein
VVVGGGGGAAICYLYARELQVAGAALGYLGIQPRSCCRMVGVHGGRVGMEEACACAVVCMPLASVYDSISVYDSSSRVVCMTVASVYDTISCVCL